MVQKCCAIVTLQT